MKTNESYEFCSSGKVAYSTFKQAKAAGIRVVNGGDRLRPYYCPECGKFHLTSNHIVADAPIKMKRYDRVDERQRWNSFKATIDITKIQKDETNRTLIIHTEIEF